MKRSLAQSIENPQYAGECTAYANSGGNCLDGRAATCTEIRNSYPSGVRESNNVFNWMFRTVAHIAVVLKGSMGILCVIIAMLTLSSCDDKEKEELDQNQIIGTWKLISSQDEQYWMKPCIFRFNGNNMLTITFAKGTEMEESVPCRYSIVGSNLFIDFGYGDEVFEGTYKINHNTLTLDLITYDPEYPSDVYYEYLTLNRIQ